MTARSYDVSTGGGVMRIKLHSYVHESILTYIAHLLTLCSMLHRIVYRLTLYHVYRRRIVHPYVAVMIDVDYR